MAVSSLAFQFIAANGTNFTAGRNTRISQITLHHMAGVMSSTDCGRIFQTPNRGASAHYGIGNGGDIAAYVDESNTAWSDANRASNCRTVSIETSNSATGGDWPVSDAALASLIKLVADIAKRNGLGRLVVGQNLCKHNDFAATTCPGPYLSARMQYIADEANKLLDGGSTPAPAPTPSGGKSNDEIANEVIAGDWGNGDDRRNRLTAAGYNYDAIQAIVNQKLGIGGGSSAPAQDLSAVADAVIRGDYGNGEDRRRNLQNAGYDYDAVQALVNQKLGIGGGTAAPSTGGGISRGDRVVVTNYVDYNGTPLVKTREFYYVSELDGNRAVLTADNPSGPVYAAVSTNNLRKV